MSQAFPADVSVGLIAMAAKPAHSGHFGLITGAAKQNDHVIVYVSTSDRKRKGQIPISGADMEHIWRTHLEGIMPGNVEVEYGGSPVFKIYDQLGTENERFEAGDEDVAVYTVYSDPEDLAKNFPEKSRQKYLPTLWEEGYVKFQEITRASTVDVSGTKMREMLANGDAEQFKKFLPDPLSDDARAEIWEILAKNA